MFYLKFQKTNPKFQRVEACFILNSKKQIANSNVLRHVLSIWNLEFIFYDFRKKAPGKEPCEINKPD